MRTFIRNAVLAVAVCGLFACGTEWDGTALSSESVGEEELASTGSCWNCFLEWSYCDDGCTPACEGVEDWSECFQWCQEGCWQVYYQCLAGCEI